MSLRVCLDCTTAFSVGAPRCPHCGSERHAEEHEAAALGIQHGVPVETEEDDMPKITRHGGASVAGEEPEAVNEAEGGEDVSVGEDSSTSSESASTKPEKSESDSPSPARTTASRSKKARTGSSSAGGTDGAPETGTSGTGSADK